MKRKGLQPGKYYTYTWNMAGGQAKLYYKVIRLQKEKVMGKLRPGYQVCTSHNIREDFQELSKMVTRTTWLARGSAVAVDAKPISILEGMIKVGV
jgi:hypothetical protein